MCARPSCNTPLRSEPNKNRSEVPKYAAYNVHVALAKGITSSGPHKRTKEVIVGLTFELAGGGMPILGGGVGGVVAAAVPAVGAVPAVQEMGRYGEEGGSLVDRLKKVKEMLDAGLIHQREYDAKNKHVADFSMFSCSLPYKCRF
jgi:hypothetical protein